MTSILCRRLTVFALLAAALSCAGRLPPATESASAGLPPTAQEPPQMISATQPGLTVLLSDADGAGPDGAVRITQASTLPLPPAATEALLRRLPPLPGAPEEAVAFALRPGSPPAPKTGLVVQETFPAPPGPAAPDPTESGPLVVLRHAPDGDVPLAPLVSVTFSQPMVALTSQDEAAGVVPVVLTPQPPGSWRWLGTKTLVFEPTGRLPMATTFTVEVPQGTRSALGGSLAAAERFTFRTPPPRLHLQHPQGESTGLTPVIVLGFDQAVDPTAILGRTSLGAGPSQVALRLATAEEIAQDVDAAAQITGQSADRVVTLRPAAPLPRDTKHLLTLAAGAPSAEGPRTTDAAQSFSFRTFPPLRVVEHRCGWGDQCPPSAPWQIELSNPLPPDALLAEDLRITPAVRDVQVFTNGNSITVTAVKPGRTTYTLVLPGAMKDMFGQTLGADRELRFVVGPADPMIAGPGREFLILDPQGPRTIPLYTINHTIAKLRVFAAGAEHYAPLAAWMRDRWNDQRPSQPPLRLLATTTVPIAPAGDTLVETPVDLAPYLTDGRGDVFLWIEPARQPANRWQRQDVFVWVQATNVGLSAYADPRELLGWATDLQTGAPLAGIELSIRGTDAASTPAARTKADGTAILTLPGASKGAQVLVARRDGRDVAFLPQNASWWNEHGGWQARPPEDALSWLVFDDRGLYRPGETASVKGYVRALGGGRGGDLHAAGITAVQWILRDSRGVEVGRGSAPVSALGSFALALPLSPTMNLGSARLDLVASGGAWPGHRSSLAIEVQEFRRPEFEVTATADPGPHVLGEHATVEVSARYFAGGGLPAAEVSWAVSSTPTHYAPPGWDGWTFGKFEPFWRPSAPRDEGMNYAQHPSRTDSIGTHRLDLHFAAMSEPRPFSVLAEATVMDVNRQAWTAQKALVVHPAALTIGLKSDVSFVRPGEAATVQVALVDLDGAALADRPVKVVAERLVWRQRGGVWSEEAVDPVDCSLISGLAPTVCRFVPQDGGSWRVRARAEDGTGRPTTSELGLWVTGGGARPSRDLTLEELVLVPDAPAYAAGQTARILVVAPFSPWEGLVTVQRSGLVGAQRVRSEEASLVVEIPIDEGHVPNLHVQVDAVGQAARLGLDGTPAVDAPPRPAMASASVELSVPPLRRALTVSATPREVDLPPGGSTILDLTVRDADGAPVPDAELVVVVVDEAVLALTGHRLPDPLAAFYRARSGDVASSRSREHVQLADAARLGGDGGAMGGPPSEDAGMDTMSMGASGGAMPPSAPGAPKARSAARGRMEEVHIASAQPMAAEPSGSAEEPIAGGVVALRANFDALALFAPEVRTDARGAAAVPVTLPDNLTRYRVMVIAVHGALRFGATDSAITARKPLMVRPSPPRFLNFGDHVELPFVLQNQTKAPLAVDLVLRTRHLTLDPKTAAAVRVSVPADDRVEVRFPAHAEAAGTARFQVLAVTQGPRGEVTDGAEGSLPVWTPATTEAFATYGVLDSGLTVQPVVAPPDVWPQFGGLEISTSSTALSALTDAVLYLTRYPFECAEQLASRALGIAALRDVLTAFGSAELPSAAELEATLTADLASLARRQNPDGGFGFWRVGTASWPWVSIHVAHAVARTERKGTPVPGALRQRSLTYLQHIEGHLPNWYSEASKRAVRAYALFVRHLLGDPGLDAAKKLFAQAGVEGLSLESLGFLLPTLHDGGETATVDAIVRHLGNRVAETSGAAHFVESYSDGAHVLLHSDRRTDGVLLDALIQVRPDSDLIPALVAGLLGHRTAGRWTNTQENVFILLALDRYFARYEGVTPDFVARAWLGEGLAGEHAFVGRTTERSQIDVPMEWLATRSGPQALTLQKEGAGRLYYRLGLRYAPRSLTLAPAERGFTVLRRYEAVDDPTDVRRDADGTWRVTAGARVRVRLVMVAPARRVHVALIDPLPAGFEALNPELAVSGHAPPDRSTSDDPTTRGGSWWWGRPWYEHENLRDERVEAFTNLLWEGVHRYSYLARATTLGVFVAPPARAEEMYAPETFGRSGTDRVVVE